MGLPFGSLNFFAYNCSVSKTIRVMSKQVNIKTFGMTEEQHKIAFEMIKENLCKKGNYQLRKVDDFTAKVWCEDTEDKDYKEFFKNGFDKCATFHVLVEFVNGVEEPIGDIAEY